MREMYALNAREREALGWKTNDAVTRLLHDSKNSEVCHPTVGDEKHFVVQQMKHSISYQQWGSQQTHCRW